MNKYRMVYQCSNGFQGEKIVYAANRMMAFEIFEDFEYIDVVSVDCFRVIDEYEEELV